MSRRAQEHFGDGVYGDDLRHAIRLHTPREHGRDVIYMGSSELWEFLRWLRLRGWLPDAALDQLKAYLPDGPEELAGDDLAGLETGECDGNTKA